MDYATRAKVWLERASCEPDDFVKYVLLYISLEARVKFDFKTIRDIKKDFATRGKFFKNIRQGDLIILKSKLEENPLLNMNKNGDKRLPGVIKSTYDFYGRIEFVIRDRNNLFHGDKQFGEERDLFIVRAGNKILEPLLEVILN